MGFVGMDVLAIQHLSRQLATQADEVNLAAAELTALINSTEWIGADHSAFMTEWETRFLPGLRRSARLLDDASAYARQSAAAQDRTSR